MVHLRLLRPLVVVSSLVPLALADYPEVNSDQCNCYLTNGSSGHYFTTHKFFDFRDKSDVAGVPALIPDPEESGESGVSSEYFSSDEWSDYWTLQSWNNSASLRSNESDSSVLMIHSLNNVYIEENRDPDADSQTFLTLRTARLRDYQSSCEFESAIRDYHFLSVRMYARTLGAPGAVTAMFTYKDPSGDATLATVQESDLEIRTVDPPDHIQYTNQPSYSSMGLSVQDATRNVTIPNKRDWTNWAAYRMDWTPDDTTWYIDGDQVASISFQTPRDPSMVIFNAWSDGGSWTGNMSVGTEARLQVQWIELVYNTTGEAPHKRDLNDMPGYFEKRGDDSCANICSIDQTTKTGTVVLLQGGASRMLGQDGVFGGICFWVSILAMALAFW
ncbi:glycoside hydrolase family 16 protein [Annulohypoxylon maeteangense]|uniref:glycoside hydrolase family 16 protein n=1 Tax=Annulohypoxylon maeteangense TaxID=1927788 RepID=UPI002007FF82|nr:glycoside hydrolase family 16 protein [Annulohypoxylon maeteangense]KAI0887377.1 glycoside hydrolase family 16 protein [Annulohypoxylon maeteangense]